MRIYDFYFPEELMKELKNLSKKTGAPVSELLRRAAREYLEKRSQLPTAKSVGLQNVSQGYCQAHRAPQEQKGD